MKTLCRLFFGWRLADHDRLNWLRDKDGTPPALGEVLLVGRPHLDQLRPIALDFFG